MRFYTTLLGDYQKKTVHTRTSTGPHAKGLNSKAQPFFYLDYLRHLDYKHTFKLYK